MKKQGLLVAMLMLVAATVWAKGKTVDRVRKRIR